jgi:hypothetical protein
MKPLGVGTLEDVAACEASFTGRYLRRYLWRYLRR